MSGSEGRFAEACKTAGLRPWLIKDLSNKLARDLFQLAADQRSLCVAGGGSAAESMAVLIFATLQFQNTMVKLVVALEPPHNRARALAALRADFDESFDDVLDDIARLEAENDLPHSGAAQ